MKSSEFLWILGAVLAFAWLALWRWQHPRRRIRPADAARYLATVAALPFPPGEREEMLRRMHQWIESDDGRPVYMLNLMRLHAQVVRLPGAPGFAGTPREANAHYEDRVMPLLFRRGGYPIYAGDMSGRNLIEHDPALDDWSRLLVVRYPCRDAFMRLVTDPRYAAHMPYKLMALRLVLSPTRVQLAIPELPWLAGALALVAFLAAGWWHAAGGP